MIEQFLVRLVSTTDEMRPVDVPAARAREARQYNINALLNIIFTFGQNDFQPKPFCSVSMNDVIVIPVMGDDGRIERYQYYRIDFVGFTPLTFAEYKNHVRRVRDELDRREAMFAARCAGKDVE